MKGLIHKKPKLKKNDKKINTHSKEIEHLQFMTSLKEKKSTSTIHEVKTFTTKNTRKKSININRVDKRKQKNVSKPK